MTTLYVVRHGETMWNVAGRYQGHLDPSLNERGLAQARVAAAQLATLELEGLYTSDLARAWESAQPLAELTGLPLRRDARLREIHQGQWQGLLVGEIRARWAKELAHWQSQPWTCSPPGGETLAHLQERLFAAIEQIATRHPTGRVAVFSHKLPIALLKIRYQHLDPATLWSHLPANGTWEQFDLAPAA